MKLIFKSLVTACLFSSTYLNAAAPANLQEAMCNMKAALASIQGASSADQLSTSDLDKLYMNSQYSIFYKPGNLNATQTEAYVTSLSEISSSAVKAKTHLESGNTGAILPEIFAIAKMQTKGHEMFRPDSNKELCP